MLTVLLSTSAIAEPTITFTHIAGVDTPVHVVGNRPALHNGTVAFYGYLNDFYGHDPVIATAPADGSGPFQVLINQGDPRPDRPGQVFDDFANPGIYNGRVLFLGREIGGFPSTYESTNGSPYELYINSPINDPFIGPNGVTTPNGFNGVSFRENNGELNLLGNQFSPFPCDAGTFGRVHVSGWRFAPMSEHHIIWPTRVITSPLTYDSAVVAYDINADSLYCIATGADTIPEFGGPFDFFYKADTDGTTAAFIGYDPTLGFGRHEGLYIRDISGTGPIIKVADKLTTSPSGGNFGTFDNVVIDGNLIIFEGCSGGTFGCDRYGIYGCFIEDGVPGEIFDIINTRDSIGGLPIIDITINPKGQDGNQLAFDIRHSVNNASLYVVTITQPASACPADLNGDGDLNFFDISEFLNTMPDFNNDGDFNFFDVSAFLAAFNAGCP